MVGTEASWRNGGIPTDLSHDSMKPNSDKEERVGGEDDGMELSLGLSTNGRFGVDPARENLRRSSSLTNVVVTDNSVGNGSNARARARARAVAFGSNAPLARAASLPSEFATQERRRPVVIRRPMLVNENGLHDGTNGMPQRQEATHYPVTRGSSSHQVPQEPFVERRPGAAPYTIETNEEYNRNHLMDMPYVTIRGPDNSQTNGFLYRYRNGEDVKIVCVCHGIFYSPAEFVKHGGCGDVNPLKHIVVTAFPPF